MDGRGTIGAPMVSHISCLPQGDPASPSGLLGPLYESMCRIRKSLRNRNMAELCIVFSIDDRSWFCSEARTTVAVATAWKKEVAQLSWLKPGENDFAAFGGIKHRHLFEPLLGTIWVCGSMSHVPKNFGYQVGNQQTWTGGVGTFHKGQILDSNYCSHARYVSSEVVLGQGCRHQFILHPSPFQVTGLLSKLTNCSLRLIRLWPRLGTVLPGLSSPFFGVILLVFNSCRVGKQLKWCYIAGPIPPSDTGGLLGGLMPSLVGQAFAGQASMGGIGPVDLGSQNQRWCVGSSWGSDPSEALPKCHVQGVSVVTNNFEEISHVLRVAWRAIRWEQYLQQNHRGEVLASLHWFDVQESFLKTRNILSSFEPHVRPHVMAVIVAHVVSPAYWGKMEQGGVPAFCSFCNQSHVPDFTHIMWTCMGFNTDRPTCPEALVQRTLGWCDPTLSTEENRRVLRHMARVRAEVVAARWAPAETTAR